MKKSSDEDGGILTRAGELSDLLGVSFRPVGITWMGNLGHILSLPSDQSLFAVKGSRRGHVILPIALKERLELDEWRPLLASGMFYQLRPEVRRIWSVAVRLVTTSIIVAIVFPFLLPLIGLSIISFQAEGLILLTLALWIILPRAVNFHVVRKLRLKTDRRVAEILGREQFLQVLEKINSLHIVDLDERKGEKLTMWKRRVSPWPTITERIDNLKRQSS